MTLLANLEEFLHSHRPTATWPPTLRSPRGMSICSLSRALAGSRLSGGSRL